MSEWGQRTDIMQRLHRHPPSRIIRLALVPDSLGFPDTITLLDLAMFGVPDTGLGRHIEELCGWDRAMRAVVITTGTGAAGN